MIITQSFFNFLLPIGGTMTMTRHWHLQAGTLIKNVKFRDDWTMCTQVATTSFFIANTALLWQQFAKKTHKY